MDKGRFLGLLVMGYVILTGCSVPINYDNAPEPISPLKIPNDMDKNLSGNAYPIPDLKE